jgi:hypothetical protein
MQSDEQVRYLLHELVARMLTRAGGSEPERQLALKSAIRDQLPGVDEFELRDLVGKVSTGLMAFANLVEQRRDRLVASGQARPHGQ